MHRRERLLDGRGHAALVLRDARRSAAGRSRRSPRVASRRRRIVSASPSASSGRSTPPGSQRSATGKRSSAGTSGAGRARHGRYSSGRVWRAISSTSVKPSVASSAVRAPRSSSSALVATVMPWPKLATSGGSTPARSSTSSTAAITPCDWSAGVVGTFAVKTPVGGGQHGVGERAAHVHAERPACVLGVRGGAGHDAANLAGGVSARGRRGRAPEHQGRVRFRCSFASVPAAATRPAPPARDPRRSRSDAGGKGSSR